MIYITAQPDDYYFTWQLELQLLNFSRLGIPPEDIHVLIGYHPERGLRHYFRELTAQNKLATFFVYPDNRTSKNYLSSIRPHIIKQHLQACPRLLSEPVFYCDSDILFRELPNFQEMLNDDAWYLSDTGYYLGLPTIKRTGSEELFLQMCSVINISPETVIQNDNNVGGAQYLLKNMTWEFWDKVEKDSETLFVLLEDYNSAVGEKEYIEKGRKKTEYPGIQSWLTDMWVVLWNAWLFGYTTKIHPELDFCWTKSPVSAWYARKILHYSGVMPQKNNTAFRKSDYSQCSPFDDKFGYIDMETCSMPVVELINDYVKIREAGRIDLTDVSFLIPVRIDSESRLINLLIVTNYLHKYFKTNILIREYDQTQKVPVAELPPSCTYHFVHDDDDRLNRTRLDNILIAEAQTPIIAIYDTDVVLPVEQIMQTVEMIRTGNADFVSPYDGEFANIDKVLKGIFLKVLDPALLTINKNKMIIGSKRSWGGSCFIRKKDYVAAGMDNEVFQSWGPEDIERVKRLEILGYKIKRVPGALFHLEHERKESGYTGKDAYCDNMEVYLKICNMTSDALRADISQWEWVKTKN
jgi:hypothetical protein